MSAESRVFLECRECGELWDRDSGVSCTHCGSAQVAIFNQSRLEVVGEVTALDWARHQGYFPVDSPGFAGSSLAYQDIFLEEHLNVVAPPVGGGFDCIS